MDNETVVDDSASAADAATVGKTVAVLAVVGTGLVALRAAKRGLVNRKLRKIQKLTTER
jgi:hypothetical protein